VHEEKDNVGVVVVEGVCAGQQLRGWIMATDESPVVVAGGDIPIGHKVAMRELKPGDTAVKYGEDIGKMVAAAAVGGHVHTHNLKTKRW
jgi:(2R)-sulfolactate sulfo-lyase subunit alpha